jgi:hypothetical protein
VELTLGARKAELAITIETSRRGTGGEFVGTGGDAVTAL